MAPGIVAAADVVQLDVGGKRYSTARATLTAVPESMLGAMFSERNEAMCCEMPNGSVFIDRDGKAFRHVLNYLRGCPVDAGMGAHALRVLLVEAQFFALDGLCEQVQAALERLEEQEAARARPPALGPAARRKTRAVSLESSWTSLSSGSAESCADRTAATTEEGEDNEGPIEFDARLFSEPPAF